MSDRQVCVMRHGRPVHIPTQAPMVVEVGVRGLPGGRGPKGDPLRFEDLTPEQKAELKGEKGDPGQDGKDGESAIYVADVADIDNLF